MSFMNASTVSPEMLIQRALMSFAAGSNFSLHSAHWKANISSRPSLMTMASAHDSIAASRYSWLPSASFTRRSLEYCAHSGSGL